MRRALWIGIASLGVAAACGGRTIEPTVDQPATASDGSTTVDPTTPDSGSSVDFGGDAASGGGGGGQPSMCSSPSTGPLPASVSVFTGCPASPPCGGDPTGTWDVVQMCALPMDFEPFPSLCAGPDKPNLGVTSGSTQTRFVFDGTQLARTVVTTMNVAGTFPSTCFVGHESDSCADKGSLLGASFPGASCASSDDAGPTSACDCNLTLTTNASCTNGYTVAGSKLLLDDGSIFSFCIDTDFLNMRQTGASAAGIVAPGLYHAQKQ